MIAQTREPEPQRMDVDIVLRRPPADARLRGIVADRAAAEAAGRALISRVIGDPARQPLGTGSIAGQRGHLVERQQGQRDPGDVAGLRCVLKRVFGPKVLLLIPPSRHGNRAWYDDPRAIGVANAPICEGPVAADRCHERIADAARPRTIAAGHERHDRQRVVIRKRGCREGIGKRRLVRSRLVAPEEERRMLVRPPGRIHMPRDGIAHPRRVGRRGSRGHRQRRGHGERRDRLLELRNRHERL